MHDRPTRLSASVFTATTAALITGITGVAGYNAFLHFRESTRPGHRHAAAADMAMRRGGHRPGGRGRPPWFARVVSTLYRFRPF